MMHSGRRRRMPTDCQTECTGIINETTSAALAYGLDNAPQKSWCMTLAAARLAYPCRSEKGLSRCWRLPGTIILAATILMSADELYRGGVPQKRKNQSGERPVAFHRVREAAEEAKKRSRPRRS